MPQRARLPRVLDLGVRHGFGVQGYNGTDRRGIPERPNGRRIGLGKRDEMPKGPVAKVPNIVEAKGLDALA